MTESEYIIISNRVNISSALRTLRDVSKGKDYGISETDYDTVMKILRTAEIELFNVILQDEEYNEKTLQIIKKELKALCRQK